MYGASPALADGHDVSATIHGYGGTSAAGGAYGVHTVPPESAGGQQQHARTSAGAGNAFPEVTEYDAAVSSATWASPQRSAADMQWVHSLDADDDINWAGASEGAWRDDDFGAAVGGAGAIGHGAVATTEPQARSNGAYAVHGTVAMGAPQSVPHTVPHSSVATHAGVATTDAPASAPAVSTPFSPTTHTAHGGGINHANHTGGSVSGTAASAPHASTLAWSDAELVAAAIREAQEETERLARVAAAHASTGDAGAVATTVAAPALPGGSASFGAGDGGQLRARAGADSHTNVSLAGSHGGATVVGDMTVSSMPVAQRNASRIAVPGEYTGFQSLEEFWDGVRDDIATNGVTKARLPLNRIKKIMKSDDHITEMISGETKACFAKACDIFVQELTWRAWQLVRKHGRNTLQLNDVSGAISSDEMYDFLIDIAPQPVVKVAMEEHPQEQVQRLWFLQQLEAQRLEREVVMQQYDGGDVAGAVYHPDHHHDAMGHGGRATPHGYGAAPVHGAGVGAATAVEEQVSTAMAQQQPQTPRPEIVYPRHGSSRRRRRRSRPETLPPQHGSITVAAPAAPQRAALQHNVVHQPLHRQNAAVPTAAATTVVTTPLASPQHHVARVHTPAAGSVGTTPTHGTYQATPVYAWPAGGVGQAAATSAPVSTPASAGMSLTYTPAPAGADPTRTGQGLMIRVTDTPRTAGFATGAASPSVVGHSFAVGAAAGTTYSNATASAGIAGFSALGSAVPGQSFVSTPTFSPRHPQHYQHGFTRSHDDPQAPLVPGPGGGPTHRLSTNTGVLGSRGEPAGHDYNLATPTSGRSTPGSTTRRFV